MTDSHSTVSGTWRTMKALCMHNQSHQAAIKTRVPFENREEELALSVRQFWESQVEGLWMPPEMGFINHRGRTKAGQGLANLLRAHRERGFRWRGLVYVCETCLFNIGLTNLEEDLQFWGCWSNHKNNNMIEEQLRNLRGRKSHCVQRLPGFILPDWGNLGYHPKDLSKSKWIKLHNDDSWPRKSLAQVWFKGVYKHEKG